MISVLEVIYKYIYIIKWLPFYKKNEFYFAAAAVVAVTAAAVIV